MTRAQTTADRVLDSALHAFGTNGYDRTSLDVQIDAARILSSVDEIELAGAAVDRAKALTADDPRVVELERALPPVAP